MNSFIADILRFKLEKVVEKQGEHQALSSLHGIFHFITMIAQGIGETIMSCEIIGFS